MAGGRDSLRIVRGEIFYEIRGILISNITIGEMLQSSSNQFTRSEYALNTKMMFFTKSTHDIVNS